MFAYCMNNPVNMRDPSGNWPKRVTNIVNTVTSTVNKAVSSVKSTLYSAYYNATKWHFEDRAAKNNPQPTYNKVNEKDSQWMLVPQGQSLYHDNGIGNPELKYTHIDEREIVFDGDTFETITDPEYIGTYNYCPIVQIPESNASLGDYIVFIGTSIGHFGADVLPYWITGKIVCFLISILALISVFTLFNLEHHHFKFEVKELKDIEVEKYLTDEKMNSYRVNGVFFDLEIREIQHDVYIVYISGMTKNKDAVPVIRNIRLSDENGVIILSNDNLDSEIQLEESESGFYTGYISCGTFNDDKDGYSIQGNAVLTLEISIEVMNNGEIKQKNIIYNINVIEYLSINMPT